VRTALGLFDKARQVSQNTTGDNDVDNADNGAEAMQQ
jgi:hypothetical protein